MLSCKLRTYFLAVWREGFTKDLNTDVFNVACTKVFALKYIFQLMLQSLPHIMVLQCY